MKCYCTLNNDYVTFYIRRVTCKCRKKSFHCTFANYSFFELPENPPHASEKKKNVFAIYRSFCEIDAFPLGVFSIGNFNLRYLKGNGNTPNYLRSHLSSLKYD